MAKLSTKPEDFVSSKEIVNALGISTSTLRRYLDKGAFPAPLLLPGRPRWLRADVEAFISQARKAA